MGYEEYVGDHCFFVFAKGLQRCDYTARAVASSDTL